MWPKGIEAETDCEWKLEAPLGQRVQVHFDQILLSDVRDEYENCLKQSIDLIDGLERNVFQTNSDNSEISESDSNRSFRHI